MFNKLELGLATYQLIIYRFFDYLLKPLETISFSKIKNITHNRIPYHISDMNL